MLLYCLSQPRVTKAFASRCPRSISFQEWNGEVTSQCFSTYSPVASRDLCSFHCSNDFLCSAFKFFCHPVCTCQLCRNISSIDFFVDSSFLLRRRNIINSVEVPTDGLVDIWLQGGLNSGHVLEFVFEMNSSLNIKMLALSLIAGTEEVIGTTIAFTFQMNMAGGGTIRSSNINGKSDPDNTEPNFRFQATNPLHVVIFTDFLDFKIYINGGPYCTFQHRVQDLGSIQRLNVYPYFVPVLKRLSF